MDRRLRGYSGRSVVSQDRGQTMQERSLFKLHSCSLNECHGASLVDATGDIIEVAAVKEDQAAHPDSWLVVTS